MIDKTQMARFCGPTSPFSTEMTVTAKLNGETETYRTPRGFRLESFVAARHPDKNIKVTFQSEPGRTRPAILVEVREHKTDALVESHRGVHDLLEHEK